VGTRGSIKIKGDWEQHVTAYFKLLPKWRRYRRAGSRTLIQIIGCRGKTEIKKFGNKEFEMGKKALPDKRL